MLEKTVQIRTICKKPRRLLTSLLSVKESSAAQSLTWSSTSLTNEKNKKHQISMVILNSFIESALRISIKKKSALRINTYWHRINSNKSMYVQLNSDFNLCLFWMVNLERTNLKEMVKSSAKYYLINSKLNPESQ